MLLSNVSQTSLLAHRFTITGSPHSHPLLLFGLLLALICVFLSPTSTQSQSQAAPYWQYDASGPLQYAVPADLDDDGVEEFVLIDELGRVTLVNAKGEREWSQEIGAPVTAVSITPEPFPHTPGKAITLGLENELVLLSNYGDEIWRIPITAVDIPLSLLTSTGYTESAAWLEQYPALPVTIQSYDYNQDGLSEILLLLHSGQLQLFDQDGNLIWHFSQNTNPTLDATPHFVTADFDPDKPGDEIMLGLFTPRRFSQLMLIDSQGELLQERNVYGQISGLETININQDPHTIVSTNRGELLLYHANQERVWLRTLNKPITSLAIAQTPSPVILVGTEVGILTAYDASGRRLWTQELAPEADHSVQHISTTPFIPQETQPLLSVFLRPQSNEQLADVLLLASDGRILEQFPETDANSLTQLVDVNADQLSELLVARFASVELQGLGIGSNTFATEWEYTVSSPPTAVLSADLNQDNIDEILIGAEDGRVHCLSQLGETQWIIAPGGKITHLAFLPGTYESGAQFVITRTNEAPEENNETLPKSIIELRQENGDKIWEQEINNQITNLIITDFNNDGILNIVISSDRGRAIVYDLEGNVLWRSTRINKPIDHLFARMNPETASKELLFISDDTLYVTNPNHTPVALVTFPDTVQSMALIREDANALLQHIAITSTDGSFSLTDGAGHLLPDYPYSLPKRPLSTLHYHQIEDNLNTNQPPYNAFLFATEDDTLINLHLKKSRPVQDWLIENLANITSLFYGNLDEDSLPEIAVGDENGNLYIINEPPEVNKRLNVVSSIFSLDAINNANETGSDLLITTGNGRVQLLSAKENRPPLLTNPQVDIDQDISSFSVSVQDVERDDVIVRLDVANPRTGDWHIQGEKQVTGSGNLVWPNLNVPQQEDGSVSYRLFFTDGHHEGYILPPPGQPATAPPSPQASSRWILAGILFVGIVIFFILIRQRQTSPARAHRFYRELEQNPHATLALLEAKYQQMQGAPDFFVNLANEARLRADSIITNLANGLFLLADRPKAGLSIMTNALDEAIQSKMDWDGLAHWTASCKTTQLLLEAPSITELSLLRPQLAELISLLHADGRSALILGELLPIVTNLRDSERVDRTDDRLVYLSEANLLTNLLRNQLVHYPPSIERTMVVTLINRWTGLLSAEIEEMRGQAELDISLRTKQLLPIGETDVVLVITNNGRSPAENILVMLDNNPAYTIHSDPKVISFLPPRLTWQIRFTIKPKVNDRFRLSLTVTYDDRNKRDREILFADMVHLMLPSQDFQPIPNPYLPGTPLRQDSTLFYGREALFAFIEENAARLSQRNVLILFGQRRTGKTSIMLRLQQHLPEHILPVYIDCQSLGVTSGMPALLSDVAWHIADALILRDIKIDVPETAVWQEEPTVLFQRRFLPEVRTLLPPDTTLLLVFDEFEAFESLAREGLLPSTFFTYIRHLMQHSEGLSFIFVGTHRLEEMTADYWSVLFNIALYEKIGFLDKAAMTRLIREPVDPYLIYDDLAVDKIERVTAGHPYFLQLVCYTLVKRANAQRSTYVTISDVNAALDEMMLLGEVHFAYIWQRSSFAEKAMLTAVAHLMDVDRLFHPEDLMQYLETYSIHLNPVDVTAALNSLTQREILAEVSEGVTTLYELKTGFIGLWVAKHKSLSKLHAEREAKAT